MIVITISPLVFISNGTSGHGTSKDSGGWISLYSTTVRISGSL